LVEDGVFVRAARGTGVLGAQNIASVLLGLAFFMVFARVVSRTEMGTYGAVYLILSILIIVGNLGLSFAASHFLPFYYGKNETGKILAVSRLILMLSLMLGIVLLIVSLILADFFSLLLLGTASYGFLFRITAIAVFTGVLGFTFDGFLRGLQKFNSLALYRLSSQVLRVGTSIGLLLLGFGVTAVFIGWIFFYVALSILAAILTIRVLLEIKRKNSDLNVINNPFPFRVIFGFSMPMMAFQLVTYLSDSVDRYVVLGLLGTESLGVYTVVMTAATGIIMILVAPLFSTLIPSMSEVYGRVGAERLSEVFRLSSRYISLIFIPTCFGFAALSPLVLRILAGSAYVEATIPLAIVSIGIGAYGFSTALLSSLTALGKTLRIAVAILFASLIEFVLCLLLVPLVGVVGAALGRTLTYIAMFGLLTFFGSRFMAISVDREALLKSTIASTVMALLLFLVAWFTDYRLIMLPIYLVFGVAVYLLLLALFRVLISADIRFFRRIIPKGEMLFCKLEELIRKLPRLSGFLKWAVKD
jgi:O-antigen/teichoic acid export membrane protein